MKNIESPLFWKTRLEDIEAAVSELKNGSPQILCRSAGGRAVHLVEYGEKEDFGRTANYNSACGAEDPRYYADKRVGSRPVILLVGNIHGSEPEAIVALINLMRVIDTGKDLRGIEWPYLSKSWKRLRLLLIPSMNPDGRVHMPYDDITCMNMEEFRYYAQGAYNDGTLLGYPSCKGMHPLQKDKIKFIPGYYNDDGINLMHDDWFNPMAEETKSLLALAGSEAPDYAILLHGGGNGASGFLQTDYVPEFVNEKVTRLAFQVKSASERAGLKYHVSTPLKGLPGYPPPAFNLASAMHHVCGGICFVFESHQGLDYGNYIQTHDQILDQHMILFEQLFRFALHDR